jgi:hypothetical protein
MISFSFVPHPAIERGRRISRSHGSVKQQFSMRSEMRAGKMPRPDEARGGPLKALRSCSQSSSTGGVVAGTVSVTIAGARPPCVALVGAEWDGCGDQRGRGARRRFMWSREGFAGNDNLVVVERSWRLRPARTEARRVRVSVALGAYVCQWLSMGTNSSSSGKSCDWQVVH